jgi:hypothetical protein
MTPQTSIDLVDALESSHRCLEAATQGLSDSEAVYKPAPQEWSVIDCIEHLSIVENLAVNRLQSAESAPEASVNAEKEKMLASAVGNRAMKIQAPPPAQPAGRLTTLAEALTEFAATRERTIEFVKGCPNLTMLRVNHPVFGQLTGREAALLIAGHSRRHAAQIAEIRA